MIKLLIDTSDNKKLIVSIDSENIKDELILDSSLVKSQACLPLINKLLLAHNLKIEDIGQILVKEGPGSFTGLRVGVSIANALSYLLKIPVNNKKIGELASPLYNK